MNTDREQSAIIPSIILMGCIFSKSAWAVGPACRPKSWPCKYRL